MSYNVTFVGLVCFFKEKGGGREAMFPDGREPGDGIDPHFPHLVVPADKVLGGDGWGADVASFNGRFDLPQCTIDLEGAAVRPTKLDTRKHEATLPRLQMIDPNFFIIPEQAETVVRIPIRQGKLRAFRYPGTDDEDPDVAIISQLGVPHKGPITITITPTDGSAIRTLQLAAGTDIVIDNVSNPNPFVNVAARSHIIIYEKLSSRPVSLAPTTIISLGVPALKTNHPYFRDAGGIGLGVECGNTGCCP